VKIENFNDNGNGNGNGNGVPLYCFHEVIPFNYRYDIHAGEQPHDF
jgi:hypothetical protein